ncbi:hypothetical protein G6O69_26955 [Pseudenhygromyxa sp. WMMC2535]|uniref:hypothetical protein n=1 Tax=Pseudenhygromyxa sp. WMMC2535 TaxID=2712867 RepID=UPI001556E3C0|nr:hypothetical protein [Pseudenhygromyxa sp. WMMC2535]NVB41507.1 hypothetical protein [Pseudenhygromyxa sp. WMMC2535]
MASVILLFSLFTPSQLQSFAQAAEAPDSTEPRCPALERMLAKLDFEYEAEQIIQDIF